VIAPTSGTAFMRGLFNEMPIDMSKLDLRSGVRCNKELCSSRHRARRVSVLSVSARLAISAIARGTQSIEVNNLRDVYARAMTRSGVYARINPRVVFQAI
jgi:exopolyphosphatase/pppGpp-phosphohydrolase